MQKREENCCSNSWIIIISTSSPYSADTYMETAKKKKIRYLIFSYGSPFITVTLPCFNQTEQDLK